MFEVAYNNRNELAGGKLQILGIANGEEQATLFAAVADLLILEDGYSEMERML